MGILIGSKLSPPMIVNCVPDVAGRKSKTIYKIYVNLRVHMTCCPRGRTCAIQAGNLFIGLFASAKKNKQTKWLIVYAKQLWKDKSICDSRARVRYWASLYHRNALFANGTSPRVTAKIGFVCPTFCFNSLVYKFLMGHFGPPFQFLFFSF